MAKKVKNINKIIKKYPQSTFIVANGLDDALIGVYDEFTLVYSAKKIIEILMNEHEMSYDEAIEYYTFNILSAKGENYPIYVDDIF